MLIHRAEAVQEWPSGVYGLPRPRTGCPPSWKEGMRYHDTEDVDSHNKKSSSYHLSGVVNKHGVRQEFCVKDEAVKKNDFDIIWPEGQYCIYKYGIHCPLGLKEGWVFWDDENEKELDIGNSVEGFVPEGVYESDTLMYFCCRTNGYKSKPIELPITMPFYLLAFNSPQCQKVKGVTAVSEFVQWDDEDRGNSNAHSKITPYGVDIDPWNTRLYYCLYHPGSCENAVCHNSSANFTQPLHGVDDFGAVHPEKTSSKQVNDTSNHLLKGKRRSSAIAVIIGCSVAGVIVGTAGAGIALKRLLRKKGYTEAPAYESDEEEVFPMPDSLY